MRNKLKTLFLTFTFSFLFYSPVNVQAETLTPQRKSELNNILIQDCGSCHGMTMKGGLGPALTPDVLKNKSRQMIEVTITYGRAGTPMPPWNTMFSKQEINWIVDTLYTGIKYE